MPVPYIPTPSLQGTALNMPTPSAAALAAPAAALGQVARGLADMGGALGQHASRVQNLENAYQESEVRQRISADMADLNQQLANNSDPASYMPLLEKSLSKQKTYLDNPDLSPVVRQKLAFHFEEISSDARLRTGAAAAGMTAKRAQLAINNELEAAATYGNREAYTQAVTRGVDAGIILPEQADTLQTNFEQRSTYDSLVKSIEADPMGASEQLNSDAITERYPHLTPENHERLKKYAAQQSNYAKADSWDQIVLSSMDGAVLSKDDVLQMAKDGDISPAQAGNYINAYHGATEPAYEPALYDALRSRILNYDATEDSTGAVRATLSADLATTPLPKAYISELSNQLKSRINPDNPDAPKHKLSKDYNTRIESEWKTEAFGNWFDYDSVKFQNSAGETKDFTRRVISEKDFDKALAYKNKVTDYFNAWLNTQDESLDPVEAGKKYNEIKSQVLREQPPTDITVPSLAPPPMFDDPLDNGMSIDEAPGVLPPKPGTETSAAPKVFKSPIKLSNYGYATDTTPDSNSAKGIGHADNKLIDGTSAAITKSLANELGLKSGDWFIANTTKGAFRLRYDDTVPDSDSRTGPLPPTIDIYRKSEGNNKWGGQILDVRKTAPPQKVSDIRSEKSRLWKELRPSTTDSAFHLINQIHQLSAIDTLNA